MNTEQIEHRAHEALKYLTDTDVLAASLKHEAERAKAAYDAVIDAIFLHEEGSVEVRKARARSSAEAGEAFEYYLKRQSEFDVVANKRRSEALAVEWCRSLYSNYRQGK